MSSELPDLPAVTSLDGDELFYLVDDPAGTPADGKITADDLAAAIGGGGAPSGPAGGVLGGTYPNPSFAADMATQVELDAAIIAEATTRAGADTALDGRLDAIEALGPLATDAELAAEAALARNADNLTSGTVADARVASTIARDSEVTAAVAVEEAARIAADALKANAANPVFTGTVTVPDAALAIADTSGLQAALDAKAALASPALTGNPTAPTPAVDDADTSIATTGFVVAQIAADAVEIQDLGTIDPVWALGVNSSDVTGKFLPSTRTHDVNNQTANYTLALTDADGVVRMTNAAARTITFPQDSDVALPVGSHGVLSSGQGLVTIVQGTGATVVPDLPHGTMWVAGSTTCWEKVAANTFYVSSSTSFGILHDITYAHANIATSVQNTGNANIAGVKTFTTADSPVVVDEAYGSGWNGDLSVPTKNAVYDKLEANATVYSTPLSATSTAVNNSTSLVDVTGMSVAVAANAVYDLYAFVPYQSGTTADIKFGWTGPSGFTGSFGPSGVNSGGTNPATALATFPSGTAILGGLAATNMMAFIYGTVRTTNAGTLQLQMAQNALEVVDTTVRANAFLRITRIS